MFLFEKSWRKTGYKKREAVKVIIRLRNKKLIYKILWTIKKMWKIQNTFSVPDGGGGVVD